MSPGRKRAAQAAGYAAFTLTSFLLFFYLSFDPNIFAPLISQKLPTASPLLKNKKITIEEMELHFLFQLELRGIKIMPATAGENAAPSLSLDRVILSPRLLSLPGLVRSLRTGTPPPISLSSYAIFAGGGKIKGELFSSPSALHLTAEIRPPLNLSRLSLPFSFLQGAEVGGLLSGRVRLNYPVLSDPSSGRGTLALEIDQLALKHLTAAAIEDLRLNKATLLAKLEGTKITLETLKFQSEDLPLNLQGTISLMNPLGQSVLDIKGPIEPSESFKSNNPLAAAFLPSSKNFSFQGTLASFFPGMF